LTKEPNVIFRRIQHAIAVAVTFVTLVLVSRVAAQTPPALPTQLSDREFWQLFTDLSEQGGSFQDENYVSNEQGYQRAIPRLRDTVKPGGVYVGVGPEQNFTYINALEPKMAFVIDIRRQNAMELLMYKALFELAPDRADFVSRLFSLPRPSTQELDSKATAKALFDAYGKVRSDNRLFQENLAAILDVLTKRHAFGLTPEDRASIQKVFTAFYESGLNIQYIYQGNLENHATYPRLMTVTDDAQKNWSYLATEDNFLRLKTMQMKNLIIPVVGDFAGPKAVKAVGKYVRDNGGVVNVFYVSNVEPYLFQSGVQKAFYDSVATMPLDSSSVFVRTFFASAVRECAATQRVSIMTPLLNNIRDLLKDYQKGDVKTQCDLVARSK
jgi:hypothetical protein